MESDVKPHPIDIGLLGAQAVVGVADTLPESIQQTNRFQRWASHGKYVLVIPVMATVEKSRCEIKLDAILFQGACRDCYICICIQEMVRNGI